jgi:hypothetical protein
MADFSHIEWLVDYISSRKRLSLTYNLFTHLLHDSCLLFYLGPESWCKIEIRIERDRKWKAISNGVDCTSDLQGLGVDFTQTNGERIEQSIDILMQLEECHGVALTEASEKLLSADRKLYDGKMNVQAVEREKMNKNGRKRKGTENLLYSVSCCGFTKKKKKSSVICSRCKCVKERLSNLIAVAAVPPNPPPVLFNDIRRCFAERKIHPDDFLFKYLQDVCSNLLSKNSPTGLRWSDDVKCFSLALYHRAGTAAYETITGRPMYSESDGSPLEFSRLPLPSVSTLQRETSVIVLEPGFQS